jgi:hypothetical protein
MAIKFKCPKCKQELNVKDDLAGKQGKCPGCKSVVTVPSLAAKSRPPAPAAAPRPARKRVVEEVVDAEVVDDDDVAEAEVVDDEPPRRSGKGRKDTSANDFDYDDEEDSRISSRRGSRRRDEEDDEDDRPSRRGRRRDDDDDEDDRPSRRGRGSSRRRRDDDDDDYDDDYDDDRGKKARARQKKKLWGRAGTGVFLNFLAMCFYTGVVGIALLMYVIMMISAASGSFSGIATGGGLAGILGYLAMFLALASIVLAVVGYSLTITTPGKNGEMGLAIASLSLGGIVLLITFYVLFTMFFGASRLAYSRGPLEALGMMMFLLPLLEIARLTVFAFYVWAVGKSTRDEGVASGGLLLGILVPSVLFGMALVNWLLVSVVLSHAGRAGAVMAMILVFIDLLGLIGLFGWYALVLSSTKKAIDYAR